MLFSFSLRGQALSWYNAQGGPTCQTFEELRCKFVAKYYPLSKVEEMRKELHRFHQFDREVFCECWERFQDLLRRCPNSILNHDRDLQIFYNGLTMENQAQLNSFAGGFLMEQDIDEVEELCHRIAKQASYYASTRRMSPKKQMGVLEVDDSTSIQAQLSLIQGNSMLLRVPMEQMLL